MNRTDKQNELNIALDLLPIPVNYGGSGRYSFNLVRSLQALSLTQRVRFYIYCNTNIKKYLTINNPNFIIRPLNLKSRIGRVRFEQNTLEKTVDDDKIDVFHAVANILPLNLKKKKIRLILTLHDLLFLKSPARYPLVKLQYYKKYVPESIRIADRIILDSKYTLEDLKRFFPEHVNKAKIIPLAPDPVFSPEGKKNSGEQYVLTVSTLEPGKGYEMLIRAMEKIYSEEGLKLYIAGPEGWKNKNILNMIKKMNIKNEMIKLLGFVDDETLSGLYRNAALFIYPSLEEGFGLPVVEALASGVKVIVPDSPHYREITGGFAGFFDVTQEDSLYKAVTSIIKNELNVKPGIEFIRRYNWNDVSKKTMEVYAE